MQTAQDHAEEQTTEAKLQRQVDELTDERDVARARVALLEQQLGDQSRELRGIQNRERVFAEALREIARQAEDPSCSAVEEYLASATGVPGLLNGRIAVVSTGFIRLRAAVRAAVQELLPQKVRA